VTFPPSRALYEHDLARVRGQLTPEAFAAAWAAGRALSQEELIADALAVDEPIAPP
jgi:hypothetical protein